VRRDRQSELVGGGVRQAKGRWRRWVSWRTEWRREQTVWRGSEEEWGYELGKKKGMWRERTRIALWKINVPLETDGVRDGKFDIQKRSRRNKRGKLRFVIWRSKLKDNSSSCLEQLLSTGSVQHSAVLSKVSQERRATIRCAKVKMSP
jgi:hypothetical protein